ncbi:hypothetical protein [Rhodoferax aquaticus]|uniref:DUF3015 domain-containing protein n=1 Tax=Rhodoferax aquaticus TaxID=2527691 RepID=A0A515EK75_9BURK|nr:hypothetical protein [Rhodoferax aquaticus]QDL53075.1 hypothetical protein EXZ61_02205 [Rhodoferax aquaticus]
MKSIRNVIHFASSAALISGGAMALALLAAPVQAQTATSVAAFCQAGIAPATLDALPANAKSNLCQWMKEAEVSPARFDLVLARSTTSGNHSVALKQALQMEADIHTRSAKSLSATDFGFLSSEAEKKRAAFYERLNQLVM